MTLSILGWMFTRQRSPQRFWIPTGKLVMESILRNESGNHSAVYPRTARKFACDLGRRNLRGVAARLCSSRMSQKCWCVIHGKMLC